MWVCYYIVKIIYLSSVKKLMINLYYFLWGKYINDREVRMILVVKRLYLNCYKKMLEKLVVCCGWEMSECKMYELVRKFEVVIF